MKDYEEIIERNFDNIQDLSIRKDQVKTTVKYIMNHLEMI